MNILVVDDDIFIRNLLVSCIEDHFGHRALDAEDGKSALKIIGRHPLDLVLLDVNLPDIEGFELLKRIRETHSNLDLPIMLVTSLNDSGNVIKGFQLGANEFITKPIDLPVAMVRIENLLKMREAYLESNPHLSVTQASEVVESESQSGEAQEKLIGACRYRYERTLGRGGFASVYLVTDLSLHRSVAMKVLDPKFARDQETRRDFLGEAQVMAQFNHPNIVAVYEVDEVTLGEAPHHLDFPDEIIEKYPVGLTFFTMRFIQGETLNQRLERGDSFTQHEVIHYLIEVTKALQYAHAKGVVHRDIKPHNIMISHKNHVMVTDFGLASLDSLSENLEIASGVLENIRSNSAACTPNYASPEQLSGEVVDFRSDIYSLGIVAYEMITGHKPFEGKNIHNLIKKQLLDPPPPLKEAAPTLHPQLEKIVYKCLEKAPDNRFESMDHLLDRLLNVRESFQNAPLDSLESSLIDLLNRSVLTDEEEGFRNLLKKIMALLSLHGANAKGAKKRLAATVSKPEIITVLIEKSKEPATWDVLLEFLKGFKSSLAVFVILRWFRRIRQPWKKDYLARLAVSCSGDNLLPLVLYGLELPDEEAAFLLRGFREIDVSQSGPVLGKWSQHTGTRTQKELMQLLDHFEKGSTAKPLSVKVFPRRTGT